MLRSMFQRQCRPSLSTDTNPPIPDHLRVADREDDGFILVGQTAIERTEVRASDYYSWSPGGAWQNQPPSYWAAVQQVSSWVIINTLTLYMLNFSEGTKTYTYILCHSSTLTWHRQLKSFKSDKSLPILRSQHHQGISNHDNEPS